MTAAIFHKRALRQGAALFKEQLKRSRTPMIVFAVLSALSIAIALPLSLAGVSAERTHSEALRGFSDHAALAVLFLTCIFTLIHAKRAFSYLHGKCRDDRIMPLPVKSRLLFGAKTLAAFAAAAAPALVFVGIIGIITVCSGETVHDELLVLLSGIPLGAAACVASYGLLAVCCTSSAAAVISFLTICICCPIAVAQCKGMAATFFYASPLVIQSRPFIMEVLTPMAAYEGVNALYWLLFILGCFVLSVFLLRRRKTEGAQTPVAFSLPGRIITVLAAFAAGMMAGSMIGRIGGFTGFVIGFLLGGGTAFFITSSIIFRKKYRLLNLITFGAVSAASIGFAAVCVFAAPAFNSVLPAREDVKSAGYLTYDASFAEPEPQAAVNAAADFDEPQKIDLIWQYHAKVERVYAKNDTRKLFRLFSSNSVVFSANELFGLITPDCEVFAYTLRDGSVITRAYNHNIMAEILYTASWDGDADDEDHLSPGYMSPLTESAAYQAKYMHIPELTAEDIQEIEATIDTDGYTIRNKTDAQKLLQAFQADLAENGFSEVPDSTRASVKLLLQRKHAKASAITKLAAEGAPTFRSKSGRLYVTANYTRTRQVLEEIGVTKNSMPNKDSPYHSITDHTLEKLYK